MAGIEPPASGLGPNDSWLNYSGDKLWIAPQGWDNDEQWPGPPDAVLDGGPYSSQTFQEDGKIISIELTGAKDKRSGAGGRDEGAGRTGGSKSKTQDKRRQRTEGSGQTKNHRTNWILMLV